VWDDDPAQIELGELRAIALIEVLTVTDAFRVWVNVSLQKVNDVRTYLAAAVVISCDRSGQSVLVRVAATLQHKNRAGLP